MVHEFQHPAWFNRCSLSTSITFCSYSCTCFLVYEVCCGVNSQENHLWMFRTSEFSSVLKRSTDQTHSRVVSLLSCLDARISEENPLCESSLLSVLRFACPGTPPRFLVGLGTNDKVVRSSDKGETWKEMSISPLNEKENCVDDNQDDEDGISSLHYSSGGSMSSTGKWASKNSGALSHLSCFEDVVAIGGKDGHFFISVDRGIHFSKVDILDHLCGTRDIQGLCLIDRKTVCVTNGQVVLSVQFTSQGEPPVTTCDTIRLLYTARSKDEGVCWIGCLSFSSSCRELIVSEPGILSISWDMGKHFISFRHNLGSIRCCDNLKALRNAQLPLFPSNSRVVLSLMKKEEKTSETLQYEYSRGTFQQYVGRKMERLIKNHQLVFPYTEPDDSSISPPNRPVVSYRYYFVAGIGTAVLPYDYSALLCVGVVHSREKDGNTAVPRTGIFAVADKVQYVPYAKSTLQESLLCATARGLPSQAGLPLPGGDTVFAVRGNNMAGVTISKDFAKWETPKATGPVALIPSDGGEMIVCIQRNVVLHLGPTETMGGGPGGRAIAVKTKFPIPKDMHIPSLCAMGAC